MATLLDHTFTLDFCLKCNNTKQYCKCAAPTYAVYTVLQIKEANASGLTFQNTGDGRTYCKETKEYISYDDFKGAIITNE